MKHTQEPWKVAEAVATDIEGEPRCIFSLSDAETAPALAFGDTPDQRDANASRIVACVNACAGVVDPAAELARLRRVEAAAREGLAPKENPMIEDKLMDEVAYLQVGDSVREPILEAIKELARLRRVEEAAREALNNVDNPERGTYDDPCAALRSALEGVTP